MGRRRMAEPRLTPDADADLDEAANYLGERNEAAAVRFLREFRARARLHAAHPRLGRPRDDLQPGLRSFVAGRYVVFFRPSADGIEVLRVLHGSRDASAELGTDEDD